MIKVLVTGAGALLGQGIIRALRQSSLKPTIVAADPSPLSAGLYWADIARLIPMANAPDYDEAVWSLLQQEKPDVVLVGTDVELGYFARNRQAIEKEISAHVIVSDANVISITDDKWLTYCFLKQHGFPCPVSALPADLAGLLAEVGFPLIVKPRRGARSVGVVLVRNEKELALALENAADLIVQECVGSLSDEFTSGLIVFDGVCRASITMRRDLRDGNTYRAFPVINPAYDTSLRAIASALKPYGPVNFQFRLANGTPKIFEINGRYSGTTPLRGLVGFPEVDMVLRYVLFHEPIEQPIIRPDCILRHWSETVVSTSRLIRADTN